MSVRVAGNVCSSSSVPFFPRRRFRCCCRVLSNLVFTNVSGLACRVSIRKAQTAKKSGSTLQATRRSVISWWATALLKHRKNGRLFAGPTIRHAGLGLCCFGWLWSYHVVEHSAPQHPLKACKSCRIICIYIYIYIYIIFTHIHVRICTYACTYICTYTCICSLFGICRHVHTRIGLDMRVTSNLGRQLFWAERTGPWL